MKQHMIVRLLLLLVVIAIVVWIARNTYWEETTVPTRLRGDAVTNPFYASQRFAESLGATTEWRQMLGDLPDTNAAIVLTDWRWNLIAQRRQQLEAWIEGGGRLLVDSSTFAGDSGLQEWSGIQRTYPEFEEDEDDNDVETEETPEPEDSGEAIARMLGEDTRPCSALETVHDLEPPNGKGEVFTVCALDPFWHLETEREIEWGLSNAKLHAARVRIGRGSVTVINAEPFGNRTLTRADHGKLFATALQLRGGDHIVFMSEQEQASILALMWRYGAPVVVLSLTLIALLLWRGGVRFGPLAAATDLARRSLAEQIRGTGRFTLRLGGGKALHDSAVRALQETAARKLPRYLSLSHADRIDAVARATHIDTDTLASAINHSGSGREGGLAQTIATLESARRALLPE